MIDPMSMKETVQESLREDPNKKSRFLEELSEAEGLTICFKDVVPNEDALGASTSKTPATFQNGLLKNFLDTISSRVDELRKEATSKVLALEDLSTSVIDLIALVFDCMPLQQVPVGHVEEDSSDCNGPAMVPRKKSSTTDGGAKKTRVTNNISSRRNAEFADYDKWDEPPTDIIDGVEMTERLCPRVRTDVAPFLSDIMDQSATTSCKVRTNRLTMMASGDPIYMVDTMRTQANDVSLMLERSCSLVNKLAYELVLMKSECSNAEQRREEATKVVADANAKMDSIIKQRVNDSLDKAIAHEMKVTKVEKDHGEKFKIYSSSLSNQ
uniref:Uncharacterized protein n=1 Tax=Cannabis sativa TaxID=3483 RepID=A0A803PRH9_CANSA